MDEHDPTDAERTISRSIATIRAAYQEARASVDAIEGTRQHRLKHTAIGLHRLFTALEELYKEMTELRKASFDAVNEDDILKLGPLMKEIGLSPQRGSQITRKAKAGKEE